MARRWSRTYGSLVTPWSICAGAAHLQNNLKDVTVPNSLCLKGREPKEGDNHHPEDNLDKFLLRALALSTYFFRDLTTLVVTGYLEVPHAFLIGLLGPSSRNRSIIKDLTLLPKWRSYVHRILFEALDRIEWLAQDTSFIDLIPRDESHATLRDELEEHVRAIGPAGGSWEPLNAAAVRLARSDPRYFQFMTPAAFSHVETLPEILETLDKPCHPFSSLRSLSFESDDGLDLYPVLYSRLFPALRDLSLSGRLDFRWPEDVTVAEMAPAVAHDIKLLRHSVTKYHGKMQTPVIDGSTVGIFPDLVASLLDESPEHLEEGELRAEPIIEYVGPDLELLDLLDYTIYAEEV